MYDHIGELVRGKLTQLGGIACKSSFLTVSTTAPRSRHSRYSICHSDKVFYEPVHVDIKNSLLFIPSLAIQYYRVNMRSYAIYRHCPHTNRKTRNDKVAPTHTKPQNICELKFVPYENEIPIAA